MFPNRFTLLLTVLFSPLMLLKDWVLRNDRTPGWLAAKIGINRPLMRRIIARAVEPRASVALEILRITGGEVTLEDMCLADAAPRN